MEASQIGVPHLLEEPSQDPVCTVGHVVERFVNEPPSDCWNPVIERYINGEVALNITILEERRLDKHPSTQYRIFLYWPDFRTFNLDVAEVDGGFWKRDPVFLDQSPRELDGAMLVGVREFVEMPEWTFPALPCAAVFLRERLLRSDAVNVGLIQPWKELLDPFPLEPFLRHEYRELDPRFRKLSVLPNIHPIGKVVETAPEVVGDFSDQHAPHWIWFAPNLGPDNNVFLCRFSVELNPWYVRVALNEGGDFRLESVDLVPGSFTFEPDPF